MANDELKAAARKELLRRKAKAELDRRRGAQQPAPQGFQPFAQPSYQKSDFALPDIEVGQEAKVRRDFDNMPAWKKPLVALDDMVSLTANGATFGAVPWAAANIRSKINGTTYEQERAPMNRQIDDARTRAGLAGVGAEIGGSMLPVNKAYQAGATLTNLPKIGKWLGMAGDGAAIGATSAYFNDQDIEAGAMYGGLGGAGGQLAGAGLSKLAGTFNKKPVLPTSDDLAAQSKEAYQQAENAGVTIKPEAMDRLRQDVYDEYANFGYHPELQPGAKVAYGELDRLSKGGNVDLKGLEGLRKIAGGGFNPMNPSNNALLGKTTGKIDEFLENIGPNDVLSGDPQLASSSLKEARRLWGQKSKLARVDDLLEKAELQAGSTGSGGNIENASRQQLKKLMTNPKLTRGMTPDEIQATKNAVLGTKTQNALRLLGKLSPQGNGLMMAIQGAGAMTAPAVSIPLGVAGFAAKKTAESMTKKNAEMLRAIIAGGGTKAAITPKPNKAQKLIEQNKELLARLIMGGTIGASQ